MRLLDNFAPGKKKRDNPMGSTQTHLRFGEIRENILVLKNGGLRTIIKTSSINFNLKSEQEQNAIINSYQGFLNSLEFPIQIVVRSKKLDLDDYIDQIKGLGEKQTNPLLQEQTYEYAQYIEKLIEYADIMDKEFYVVVPYDAENPNSQPSIFQGFFQRLSPKDSYSDIDKRRSNFPEHKKALLQRVNVIKSGLENCGLKAEELKTKEIIGLFYNIYNPITSRSQKLKDLDKSNIETDDMKARMEGATIKAEDLEIEESEETAKTAPLATTTAAPAQKTPEATVAAAPPAPGTPSQIIPT